jgi:hypothetical protein
MILDWFADEGYRCPAEYDLTYDFTESCFHITCTDPKLETLITLKFG